LFDDACEEAEVIAAVRFERGGGHRARKVDQKPGKFINVRKTFAGSNNVNGNQRGQNIEQAAGASKFKVFVDFCRECHNNLSMMRKELHSFPMCPNNKAQAGRKGQAKKGAWPKRKVNAVTNEQETYGYLTEHEVSKVIRSLKEELVCHID
jgi:hypothetical protein